VRPVTGILSALSKSENSSLKVIQPAETGGVEILSGEKVKK
jgi:hypothetical protein